MNPRHLLISVVVGVLATVLGIISSLGRVPTRDEIELAREGLKLQIIGYPDFDGDGVRGPRDNCGFDYNPGQENADGDPWGDICDTCPNEPNKLLWDKDGDGVGDGCDNCPDLPNAGQEDFNADGVGDHCQA